jgi:L-methionine (R)-S-oxide reductase
MRSISNLANSASLIYHALRALPEPSSSVNWAGFYIVYPQDPSLLVLGPFMGHVACQTIKFGRGVCGAAASDQRTQLVPNVEEFPGHIACDSASKSELVVPITKNGQVVAIIDLDCAQISGFGEEDKLGIQELASVLSEACDWPLDQRS